MDAVCELARLSDVQMRAERSKAVSWPAVVDVIADQATLLIAASECRDSNAVKARAAF